MDVRTTCNKKIKETHDDSKLIFLEKTHKMHMAFIRDFINTRDILKCSQSNLAKITGVQQPIISRFENNISNPHLRTILKLLAGIGYKIKLVPDKEQHKK